MREDRNSRIELQQDQMSETRSLLHGAVSVNAQDFGDGPTNGNPSIPFMIWLVMKICCVFYQRPLIGLRRCLMCQIEAFRHRMLTVGKRGVMSEYFPTEFDPCGQGYTDVTPILNMYRYQERGNCKLCCSFWWTTDVQMCKYTDDDIGGRYWNHSGSWLLSVILLFLAICFTVFEFISYAYHQKRDPHQFVHVISYFLFLMELSLYPIVSLYSKLMVSTQQDVPLPSWSVVFNSRYLIKRLQFIDFSQGIPGKLMLFLCFAWPMALLIHRVLVYEVFCNPTGNTVILPVKRVSLVCTFILMVVWACSQYLMFLCRVSFLRQFQLVHRFIRYNQTDIDSCRRIAWHAVYDFNCYRRFVYIYMRLMIPFSAWAITTVLYWQYSDDDTFCTSLLWMVWSQIGLFLGISLSSAGGLDVAYMWNYLQHTILTTERDPLTERFWSKMRHHLDHLCGDAYCVDWTVGMSFATVIIAIYSSDISSK